MELRQLRYLVRVIELGSISRAALDQLQSLSIEAPPALPAALSKELRGVLTQTVCYLLGKRPRLLNYLE